MPTNQPGSGPESQSNHDAAATTRAALGIVALSAQVGLADLALADRPGVRLPQRHEALNVSYPHRERCLMIINLTSVSIAIVGRPRPAWTTGFDQQPLPPHRDRRQQQLIGQQLRRRFFRLVAGITGYVEAADRSRSVTPRSVPWAFEWLWPRGRYRARLTKMFDIRRRPRSRQPGGRRGGWVIFPRFPGFRSHAPRRRSLWLSDPAALWCGDRAARPVRGPCASGGGRPRGRDSPRL
jgi:hypothetical protein